MKKFLIIFFLTILLTIGIFYRYYSYFEQKLTERDNKGGYAFVADHPEAYMTRYEFLVALCKTLNIKEESGPAIFRDTGEDQNKFIYPAFKRGIVVGFPDKNFGPNMLITENEALIMIARAKKQHEPSWSIFSDLLTQERCAKLLSKI